MKFDQAVNTINEWQYNLYGPDGFRYRRNRYSNFLHDLSIKNLNNEYDPPFEICKDNLLFTIWYSGDGIMENEAANFELIWDGFYQINKQGRTIVNLAFASKNFKTRKRQDHKQIKFDLTRIKTSQTNELYINFIGYNKLLKFSY
ncbi:MAG: hypothetical protein ABJG41_02470 [Cyclobacteriaceae bacterium]